MSLNPVRRLFSAAFIAALLGGCAFGRAPEPTPIPLLINNTGAVGTTRTVYTVERGPVIDELRFPAEVNLATREDLFFASPGRVQEVYVNSGDTVEMDEVIAVLDTRLLEFDLQGAEETLALAKQQLARAEANLRFQTLQRQTDLEIAKLRLEAIIDNPESSETARSIQELAVQQVQLSLDLLEAGVDPRLEAEVRIAEITLEKVKTALADAQITAPFSGQVLLYDALKKGKVVQAYAPIAALVDPEELVLQANVVPTDLESLQEGMAVSITLQMPLAKVIPGVIRTLPQPFGTGAGPSVLIEPADPTAANQLRSGASVEVSARRNQAASALWLPPDAIQGYKDNYYVRMSDGRERPISVGIFAADRVEIASGLVQGDEVVGQ